MKLAWFTSFSRYSAIGQCSLSILRALPSNVEVTLFASDIRRPSEALSAEFDMHLLWGDDPNRIAEQMQSFDAAIYNLGDHFPMHHRTYEVASKAPGIVVLHDLVMHHFFSGKYLSEQRDEAGYLNELHYTHGSAGRRLGEDILSGAVGHDVWDSPRMLQFHMATAATRNSLGVVVHSQFARGQLEPIATTPVRCIPFPAPLAATEPHVLEAPRVRVSNGSVRLLTLGVVNRNKLIDQVIRTIGQSDILRQSVTYDVIGDHSHSEAYSEHLRGLIREYGLTDRVHILGRQSDETLRRHVEEADIVLNLRNPHFGESSWSLLESMFAGKATIVWKHGFYDEVPDASVGKIASTEELAALLTRLSQSPAERASLGERAQAYARATFSAQGYGRRLLDFNDSVRYNAPVLRLADFAATVLGELGATDGDVVGRVAGEVCGVGGVLAV